MRILSVSNCPLDSFSGSGYVITGYADGARARGHQVVTLDTSSYEWMPRLKFGKRLRVLCGYSFATLRALKRDCYDAVELWGAEAWWVMGRLARRANRPLLVARSNGLEPHFAAELARHGLVSRGNFAGRCFDRWTKLENAFCRADALTTVSHWDRRFAIARGYQSPERLLTIETPLPDNWVHVPPQPRQSRIIGFVGAGGANKGAALLAQALIPVLRTHADWQARFVGTGTFTPLPLFPSDVADRIEVIPFVRDREKLRRLYLNMEIAAMPSAFESFGLVAAEALACGCALVASPTGFAAGLQPNIEGVLVTERTSQAWSAAIERVIRSAEFRRTLARNGHARVQSLRWPDAIEQLFSFYNQLLTAVPQRSDGSAPCSARSGQ